MELEPITRQEKIIAGQDLTPITRMEMFLKQYGGGGGGGGGSADAVLYTAQTLTDAQKKQARENIGAAGEFVIHATPTSDWESATLDKTFDQIQEAIGAGKTPIMIFNDAVYLQFINKSDNYIFFSAASGDDSSASFQYLYVYPTEDPYRGYVYLPIIKSDGTMPQVSMESDPTADMEIATKKYVDDNVCILHSTTPGSTKKFKITVDDSGAISATEVTA